MVTFEPDLQQGACHTRRVALTNGPHHSRDLLGSLCLPTRPRSLCRTGYSIGRTVDRGNVLVAPNGLALLEAELIHDRPVIRIPFFHVRMPGCKVSSDEAEICVMILEADGDGPLVPRHPSHSRL